VVRVVDGHTQSGLRADLYDQANLVEVLHADGTLATYAHLRRGAQVEVGQQVATGERIGFSGDSGYAGGPHLHFMVWKREADLSATGVPVRFHDGSAQGFVPRVGAAYAPACQPSGQGCAPDERPPAAEALPARRDEPRPRAQRRADGACACANGALIHVDLPCDQVCAR
jgi:murein DD-endopeptidase MepM/ murein hydrolase activator NlpD